jgi:hypothetical protein
MEEDELDTGMERARVGTTNSFLPRIHPFPTYPHLRLIG